MNDLNCSDLTAVIKGDFGALWQCRQRGKSLEITTPYLYPDSSFVSLFVTKRANRFIVSDGGHVSEFFQSAKDDEAFFASIIAKSRATHNVSHHAKADRQFYFKETTDKKLISSIVFDVANFLVATSNTASLAADDEDSQDKNSFRMRADKFIKPLVTKGRSVKFNYKLEEVKEATFSAVIRAPSKLWLVIYLTGSNLKYFQLSVSNAIVNVEFARKSTLNTHVEAIIPFLNNEASGFQHKFLTERLARLTDLTKGQVIPWNKKEEIIDRIAC